MRQNSSLSPNCRFEIEQQRNFQTSDVQVSEHLGDVGFVEFGDDFGIGDHGILHHQIRNQRTGKMSLIPNRILALVVGAQPHADQLDHERLFVK